MIALGLYRTGLHSCGHPLAESTDPANEGRYVVQPPTRCHACSALEAKQSEYRTSPQPTALLWRAERG